MAADYNYDPNVLTDVFVLDNTKSGFIQINDRTDEHWLGKLHVFEETEEVAEIDINIPIPQPYKEIMNVEGVTCYDGTIAVAIRSGDPVDYSMISNYYKIDQNGNVLAGPFSMVEELNIFPVGNGIKGTLERSGAVGAPELENDLKMEIFTIDFENEPTSRLINMQKYMSKVYALDEESYVVIEDAEQGYIAGIFNDKDELIKSLELSDNINGNICAAVKADDNLAVMYSTYLGNDGFAVFVSEYDMKGTKLGTHEVVKFKNSKSTDGWKFEKTSWGYSLSNYTSGQTSIIYFLNDEFELISSMQVPDSLSGGTHMGSRYIVKWYDVTILGYKAAITEPIVTENTENNDTPKPEKPSEDGKENAAPDTGDSHNLLLLLLAISISGSIIVGCIKRDWQYKL